MCDYNLSYREVIPDQTVPATWKEVSLNTGGTQSTLQDIKVAEKANGYCYRDATRHLTRNRFIYWRINNDTLELAELSLDVNLSGNRIRYKFLDTPVLDGITIHETYANVIILVPTVCSVHRLIFPHPDRLHRQDELLDSHPDLSLPSIFSEVASTQNRGTLFYVYIVASTANSQLPHSAASWLTYEEEAIFLLAYPSSELILVRQQSNGDGETIELKYESMMPKFLTGMFRSRNNENNVIVSMILHTIGIETYAITLCRDGQLRVWSCSKAQCIAVSDILSETLGGRTLEQGAQNHMIRKVVGADETNFVFAIFLSFSKDSHFDILKPIINGNQFTIVKVYSLYSPIGDLIDFSLTTSRIWSVWRSKEGEWNVYSALFNAEGDKRTRWVPIALEALPNPDELPTDDCVEPKQTYLQYIFSPGRFPLQIISKALSIYKRSIVMGDMNLSAAVLKQRVCVAVEQEIQTQLQECEVTDEDYLEAANWCWSRFYSCCVQYHVAGLRPLGVLLLPSVSGVVLLKKAAYSFLRPLDVLEYLMFCSEHVTVDMIYGNTQLSNTQEECNDLIVLTNILVFIEEQLSDLFKSSFEKDLAQSMLPNESLEEIMSEINMDEDFSDAITEQLNRCSDLYAAMHKILELLRMDQPIPESDEFPKELKTSVMHLFSSQLGVSVISQCFNQQTNTKFAICRNLLILQHLILEGDSTNSTTEAVRSVCMPEVVVLLQSYFALSWLSQLTASPVLPIESQMQRLACLKLAPVFNLRNNTQQVISLIELYAGSTGGSDAHKALLKYDFDEDSLSCWHTALLPYLTQLTLIIWPINGAASFTEWLLSSGQHVHLQQYVSLIESWCDWNNLTRSFLLAVALLGSGETQKAYDLFLIASKGVYSQQFIIDRVGNIEGSEAFILYYLKVIQLFEYHGARNYVIEAANSALAGVGEDEPLKTTLYSIKFKHHLALCHFDEAFDALASNPDAERKKDNLRDLVKTLLDGKHLDILMSFNYAGMEELFFSILFTRARATDSVGNVYYDFLYAYCIRKNFMRLAGSVMYEQAYRLNQHTTIESLEKQVKCLLASVNSLSLADPLFAWVMRPADPDLEEEEHILPPEAGTDEEPEVVRYKLEVEVIDIVGIKKELTLAKAKLQLARLDPKSISNYLTTPTELVMFLSSAGIYKTSFAVCQAFDLPYNTIFELLTNQCVTLTEREDNKAWNWLIENDLHDMDFIANSPSGVAWALLQNYLEQYEQEHMTVYHRVVAEKMLHMGCSLPHWLVAAYKLRNPAELLRLNLFMGYLEDAYDLAMDYLKAALGYGAEFFGLKNSLTPVGQPLCLPLNIIDMLIYELELQNENDAAKPFEKVHANLKDLFRKYLDTMVRISYDVGREKMSGMF